MAVTNFRYPTMSNPFCGTRLLIHPNSPQLDALIPSLQRQNFYSHRRRKRSFARHRRQLINWVPRAVRFLFPTPLDHEPTVVESTMHWNRCTISVGAKSRMVTSITSRTAEGVMRPVSFSCFTKRDYLKIIGTVFCIRN